MSELLLSGTFLFLVYLQLIVNLFGLSILFMTVSTHFLYKYRNLDYFLFTIFDNFLLYLIVFNLCTGYVLYFFIYIYIYIYIYICMYVCMHARMHRTHVRTYVRTLARMQANIF